MGCLIKLLLLPFYLVYGMCIFIVEIVKAIFKAIDNHDKNNFTPVPSGIPNMTTNGHEYEYFVAEYLRRSGYSQVTVTKGSGDYGVDVLATKDGIKYAVQCKYYSSPVNLKAVQEVVAGAPCYGCNAAMVVTNSTFTKSAVNLATANGVILLSYVNSLPPINYPQNPVMIEEQKPKRNNKKKWIIITVIYIVAILFSIALFDENAFKYIRFDTLVLVILIIIDLIKYRKHLSLPHISLPHRKVNKTEPISVGDEPQADTPDLQITETEPEKSSIEE